LIIGIQLYWVVWWLVPADGSQLILYILAYIVLAGVALYLWHKEPPVEHLAEPSEWAMAVVGSILMAGVSLGIDVVIGLINHPNLTPIEAGTRGRKPIRISADSNAMSWLYDVSYSGTTRCFAPAKWNDANGSVVASTSPVSSSIRTYRDLKKAPATLRTCVPRRLNVQPYLNHAVSEGSSNREISLPGVNARLSVKQISSSSVRPHVIC